jgi:hypothetical protein
LFTPDPAESWGAPPGRNFNQGIGEREMTHTLEGTPARRPLERCVTALSGDSASRMSNASVTAVAGPRGEAPTP